MPDATITVEPRTATPAADDVLTVTGTVTVQLGADTYSCDLTASGWASAVHNHYPADAYTESDQGPQLAEGVQPRAMTADEVRDYCTRLLVDAFVAATPLVKQTAANLLDQPAGTATAPAAVPAPTPTMEQTGARPQPAPAEQAPATGEGAPPMEGNPAPPTPPM